MNNLINRIRTAQVRAGENEVIKHLNEIGPGDEPKNSTGVVNLSNVVRRIASIGRRKINGTLMGHMGLAPITMVDFL